MIKPVIALSIVGLLSGCSQGMVGCNDSDIKSRVLDTLYEEGGFGKRDLEKIGIDQDDLFMEDVVTKEKNTDIGLHKCVANYSVEVDGETHQQEFSYKLTYIEDKDETRIEIYRASRVINHLTSFLR